MKAARILNKLLTQLKRAWKFIKECWVFIIFLVIVSLFAVGFIALLGVDWNCKGNWVCNLLGVTEKESAVKMLGFSFIALLGIWVANRRAAAMDKTAQAQADTVLETERGRRQERFRDAVNHLGSKSESVRLGGAHALFHLALEEESRRRSIADILCAHIRGITKGESYKDEHTDQSSAEIQSLMALLFVARDSGKQGVLNKFWKDITPDLSGGYFRGLKLDWAEFQKANLKNVQFQGAEMLGNQFQGANLENAQFQGASLWQVQFQGARLSGVQFQGTKFLGPNFQKANLHEARFQGADLDIAGFQGANLFGAEFQGARLYKTQFQEADFLLTKFHGVSSQGSPITNFQRQIRDRSNEKSDFSKAIFSGSLTQREVNNTSNRLKGVIGEDKLDSFRKKLEEHIGKPPSNDPPQGVETGAYSKEEVEQWIAEYEKAVGLDEND